MTITRLLSSTALIVALVAPASLVRGASLSGDGPSSGSADIAQAEEPAAESEAQEEAVLEAEATEDEGDEPGSSLGNFVVGLHIAPYLPVFSDLKVFVLPRLELGYHLPFWGRRIEVFFSVAYSAPVADGEITDSRLPNSGSFNYEIRQKQLMLGLGLYVRLFELGSTINPYIGIGPLLYLMETVANGDAAGEAFGENTETSDEIGLYGALGLELVLGPGAGFFELGITWSNLDTFVTGDSNTGALSPTLGYRFMF